MIRQAFCLGACALAMWSSRAVLAQSQPVTLLVEAESFQFYGDWTAEKDDGASGQILRTVRAEGDAVTVVEIPADGEYKLYVRSRDYTMIEPGKRRFKLVVDGVEAPKEAGAHGMDGYHWDLVDTRRLTAGRHVLALHDTAKFYARCDAVLLTTGDADPEKLATRELAGFRVAPVTVEARRLHEFPRNPVADPASLRDAATIGNDHIRLTFRTGRDATGKPTVVRAMAVKDGDAWREVPIDPQFERLFVLYTPDSGLVTGYFPAWSSGIDRIELRFGDHRYETSAGKKNPFWAAEPTLLVPRGVRPIDDKSVEVVFETPEGKRALGQWSLGEGGNDVKFTLAYRADADGEYSIGFTAFRGWERDAIAANLIPPQFNFQRLPAEPNLTTNTIAPHALALAQLKPEGDRPALTVGVVADPSQLPMEWPEAKNARYGFSLVTPENLVQPAIFQPVLGMPGSKVKKGETIRVSWHVLAVPGGWEAGLEYASNRVMKVRDYREPWTSSLTDAALNMIDLIKDDFAGGWEPNLKGFYNIEAIDVASQAAPLAVVSAAMLTGDEEFWARRALPTIAFTLSRPSAHFATQLPNTWPSYVNERSIQIKVPGDYYGTAYWQGVHALLGEANPWIVDVAMPDGQVRHRATNVAMPRWSELMGAYRLDPTPARLEEVRREADAWIEKEFGEPKTDIPGMSPFYNMQFYPYWWDLIDLYEITRDSKYLGAAEKGAFQTIAGQWSHPFIPETITIHPGNEFRGNDHLWWRGTEKFRLGFPRKPGDTPEKRLPAWVVSNVGLSFEQPSTYYGGGTDFFQMIMMNNFAPHLLRVYEHTGRDIYKTYARNAIVGRWANYPGYYQRGYTDLMQDARYPYEGPDVTSIYYHHIPCHLLFTMDWLVTDAEVRSGGKIRFPYAKQQGYVWFVNRVFGASPNMLGEVFGDKGVKLSLDRTRVKVAGKEVNHLVGRSADRVWVILTNDAKRDVTAKVALDAAGLGLRSDAKVRVVDATGATVAEKPLEPTLDVPVAQGGLVALAIDAAHAEIGRELPPLENGRVGRTLPGDWKSVHAFRIRSPFRKDALYVVLTGRPGEGAGAQLTLGEQTFSDDKFPHEFIVYPLPMEQDATFTIELRDAEGKVTNVGPMTLPGTKRAASAKN